MLTSSRLGERIVVLGRRVDGSPSPTSSQRQLLAQPALAADATCCVDRRRTATAGGHGRRSSGPSARPRHAGQRLRWPSRDSDARRSAGDVATVRDGDRPASMGQLPAEQRHPGQAAVALPHTRILMHRAVGRASPARRRRPRRHRHPGGAARPPQARDVNDTARRLRTGQTVEHIEQDSRPRRWPAAGAALGGRQSSPAAALHALDPRGPTPGAGEGPHRAVTRGMSSHAQGGPPQRGSSRQVVRS